MKVRCPRCKGPADLSPVRITHPVPREVLVVHCQCDFQHVHELTAGEELEPYPTALARSGVRESFTRLPTAYHVLKQALEDWLCDAKEALEKRGMVSIPAKGHAARRRNRGRHPLAVRAGAGACHRAPG